MKKKKQRLPASMNELYPAISSGEDSIDQEAPTLEQEFDRVVDEMLQSGFTKEEAIGLAAKMYGGTPEEVEEATQPEPSSLFRDVSRRYRLLNMDQE